MSKSDCHNFIWGKKSAEGSMWSHLLCFETWSMDQSSPPTHAVSGCHCPLPSVPWLLEDRTVYGRLTGHWPNIFLHNMLPRDETRTTTSVLCVVSDHANCWLLAFKTCMNEIYNESCISQLLDVLLGWVLNICTWNTFALYIQLKNILIRHKLRQINDEQSGLRRFTDTVHKYT